MLDRQSQATFMERIDGVDALRGFALMGLFLVHASEYFELYWLDPPKHNLVHDIVFGLFAGKSFAMFAMMFGFSFFIIMDRSSRRGVDFSVRFFWRLTLLFVFGFFDALVYAGEVLQVLALCGLVLVPVNRLSWRWLLPLAGFCLLGPQLIWIYWRANTDLAFNVAPLHWKYPALEVFAHGDVMQLLATNLWQGPLTKWQFYWETGRIFEILGLFLCGLMLGRIGFFQEPERFARPRRLAFAIALGVLLGLQALTPWIETAFPADKPHFLAGWARDTLVHDVWQPLAGMTLWVTGFVELYQWAKPRAVLRLLAPAGRMTLTLYVSQGVIGIPLFYGCGLGLYATIGQPRALLLGAAVFAAQVVWAHWWFKRFLYGPLEWLWRAGTFGSLAVPFRRVGLDKT